MRDKVTIKDIMTKDVICVHPETSILVAHQIMSEKRFNGLPVVDNENHLVGIITEYDLLVKGSSVHLPTLQKLFTELPVYKKNYKNFKNEIYELSRLTVREVMNSDPLAISQDANLSEMVDMFRQHHRVNPLAVIDKDRKVVGIVSRYDAVNLFYVIKLTKQP